jgi:hypothetical protein
MGEEASQFLDEVFPPGNPSMRARTVFLRSVSFILARYLGKCTEASWNRQFNV